MKTRIWKISRWFLFIFIALFLFRFIYGYFVAETEENYIQIGDYFSSVSDVRKNYATEKNKSLNYSLAPNLENQKYEKTASMQSKSAQFEEDEKNIRLKTLSYEAVIQYEQNMGQPGGRQLHLMIGVNPEKFDAFVTELKSIGTLSSIQITKVDKTNEFRELNAEKISVEKSLQSLYELKTKGGQVGDFIALNDKILETEQRLQSLGVELGNFDSINEFCTVKFSMHEGAAKPEISILHRIKVALIWTIETYLKIIASIAMTIFFSFILILVIDKLNQWKVLIKK